MPANERCESSPKAMPDIPGEALFPTQKGTIREHPVLGSPIADSHAHLDMLKNPPLVLASCAVHGVGFVCCMVDPSENTFAYSKLSAWLQEAKGILDAWASEGHVDSHGRPLEDAMLPAVRLMPGVHPHAASKWNDALRLLLEELLQDARTCGIGEIGLDYHYDFSPRKVQRDAFAEQLAMAEQSNRVVSLHIREAHGDALAIMREVGLPQAGCILHCCTIGANELQPFLELGCYVAYGGALTFANSDYIREGALSVPKERLLIETDSPYMAPKPLRGTQCTPAHAIYTAQALESLRREEGLLAAVFDSTVRLLGR